MNNKSKMIILASTLLLTLSGGAVAFGGYGNCMQGGPGMQGNDQYMPMQGNMRGKHPMKRHQGQPGQRRMGGKHSSPMRAIYRLNNLTNEQLEQLDTVRLTQQEWRTSQQAVKQAHRNEMKTKIDAILTEEQRQTLNRWN